MLEKTCDPFERYLNVKYSATRRMSSSGNGSELRRKSDAGFGNSFRPITFRHHYPKRAAKPGSLAILAAAPERGRVEEKQREAEELGCPAHFGPRTLSTDCQVDKAGPQKPSSALPISLPTVTTSPILRGRTPPKRARRTSRHPCPRPRHPCPGGLRRHCRQPPRRSRKMTPGTGQVDITSTLVLPSFYGMQFLRVKTPKL